MQDFREACIIFSAENYTEALYVKEFMKWIGVSYFTYVYNEIDEKLNMDVLENDNDFDVVFYINSEGKVWNGCLNALTKAKILISCGSIWDKNSLLEIPLKEAMDSVCDCFQLGEKVKAVFEKLVSIYCKYDVLRKLVNNVYSLYMVIDNPVDVSEYSELIEMMEKEYMPQYEQWNKAIKELEDLYKAYELEQDYCGKEYLLYALCYSKRKINEVNIQMNRKKFIDTPLLLEQYNGLIN